MAEDRSNH